MISALDGKSWINKDTLFGWLVHCPGKDAIVVKVGLEACPVITILPVSTFTANPNSKHIINELAKEPVVNIVGIS